MSRSRNRYVSTLVLPLTVLLAVVGCGDDTPEAATGEEPVTVGVFQLSQATLLDDIVAGFEQQLTEELAPRPVKFELKNAQGDNSLIQSIAKQFKDSDADLFAVAGTPGIIALSQLETRRPIIGLAMTDPVQAKVAKSLDASGTNVTGSLGFIEPSLILEQVGGITPAPRRIGTVYDPSNEASSIWVRSFKAALQSRPGTTLVESTIASSGDITSAARSLVGRTDLWVTPPDTTVMAGLPAVGAVASGARVPLVITGGNAQTPGVLASVGPDYAELGRLAAGPAAEILSGRATAATAPFVRPSGATWGINQTTLKALGVTLPSSATATPEASAAPSTSATPSS